MEPIIKLGHVSKTFKQTVAVDHISFSVKQGEIVALLGPNGAGKSTTISLLIGLLEPTGGEVSIFGKHPRAAEVRKRLGVLLQENQFVDGLTVYDLLYLFRSYYDQPLSIEQLLAIAGLEKEKNHIASKLSGGQKRRLSFALSMAGDPDVLILDEPTAGMDLQSREQFWMLIQSYVKKGKTILFTTHYLEEAEGIADRIILINQGKVVADGTPQQLKNAFSNKMISFVSKGLTEKMLSGLPGVLKVDYVGERIVLYTTNCEQTLKYMFKNDWDLEDLEVRSGGLRDVFQSLIEGEKGGVPI